MHLRLNERRLAEELSAFVRGRLPAAVSKITRAAVFGIGGEIVRSLNGEEAGYPNPKRIDTGRYRAAWAMGVQAATGDRIPAPASTDPNNPTQAGDGAARLTTDSGGLTLRARVDNNVEYGADVEYGTAGMRPGLHVARAVLVEAKKIRTAAGKAIPDAWED